MQYAGKWTLAFLWRTQNFIKMFDTIRIWTFSSDRFSKQRNEDNGTETSFLFPSAKKTQTMVNSESMKCCFMGIPQTYRDEERSMGAQTCDTNSVKWRVLEQAARWLIVCWQFRPSYIWSTVCTKCVCHIAASKPQAPPPLTSLACRHPLSKNAPVRAQREICGGQHGTRTGFPPSTSVCLFQYYSTSVPFCGATAPSWPGPPHYRGFTITLRHTTVGRTPLDEWSARLRDLYLTAHNTHNRQIFMPATGFEFAIPVNERPGNHAVDRASTGICTNAAYSFVFI